MNPISFEELPAAVAGGAVALRSVTLVQLAGGRRDRVYPATHADGGRTSTPLRAPVEFVEPWRSAFALYVVIWWA